MEFHKMNEKYELYFLATLVASLILCNVFCYYCNNDKDRLECFDEVKYLFSVKYLFNIWLFFLWAILTADQ